MTPPTGASPPFLPESAPLAAAAHALLAHRIYVMVRCGHGFRVPYAAEVWQALAGSGEYEADFFPFLLRFMEALQAPGWPAGSYFPGGWYRALKAQHQDVATVAMAFSALGPFHGEEVRIDPRGTWTIGRKMISGRVLEFFLQNLHFDPELQRYAIRYDLASHVETRYVQHESLPFRIVALDEGPGGLAVQVNDGRREQLRWDTLRMDAAERLYCAIRPERVPALFTDGPRFRLLDRLEERDGQWWAAGVPGPLDLHAPWPGAGSLTPLPPVHAVPEAPAS